MNDHIKEIVDTLQQYIDNDDLDGLQERAEAALHAYRTLGIRDINTLLDEFGALKSKEFKGKVIAQLQSDGRICYHGSGLPPAPELAHVYPNGWSLMDHIEPRRALRLVNLDRYGITRDFDPARLDNKHWPHAAWQVIYKTKEGLDYCRESYIRGYGRFDTVEEVEDEAMAVVRSKNLGGAVIQYW